MDERSEFVKSSYAPDFTTVLRGYDRAEVTALCRQVAEAQLSGDPRLREAAHAALAQPALRVRFRGYDREQVDNYLARLAQLLAD